MGRKRRTFEAIPPPPPRPEENCPVSLGCNGLLWEDRCGITPLTKIAMYVWAEMGCNERTFEEFPSPPLNKISMSEWAAMGCNWRTFEELQPST